MEIVRYDGGCRKTLVGILRVRGGLLHARVGYWTQLKSLACAEGLSGGFILVYNTNSADRGESRAGGCFPWSG
jgi:hypothetical protein